MTSDSHLIYGYDSAFGVLLCLKTVNQDSRPLSLVISSSCWQSNFRFAQLCNRLYRSEFVHLELEFYFFNFRLFLP